MKLTTSGITRNFFKLSVKSNSMQVPFLDLKAGFLELQAELEEAAIRSLRSGWYILGSEVDSFEKEYAQFCQAKHCIGTGNGLDALTISLKACGIGPGDDVLVPSHTFVATWLAVHHAGARLVPVEPRSGSFLCDADDFSRALTNRTKAIVPVHLYGQPCQMDGILSFAKKNNLFVIEDAAQCQGALFQDRRIGSHGDLVAWSFYPAKNLGACGDAGCITSDNDQLAAKCRMLGNYGSEKT